jgi:hypothetical protein
MPTISLATEFLASSLLTILLPLGVLIAIAIWYVISIRRVPEETPVTSAKLPPPEVVAAAGAPPAEDPPGRPPTGQP